MGLISGFFDDILDVLANTLVDVWAVIDHT
jgi:hypothetical protein